VFVTASSSRLFVVCLFVYRFHIIIIIIISTAYRPAHVQRTLLRFFRVCAVRLGLLLDVLSACKFIYFFNSFRWWWWFFLLLSLCFFVYFVFVVQL
jgi:hypothetical protein